MAKNKSTNYKIRYSSSSDKKDMKKVLEENCINFIKSNDIYKYDNLICNNVSGDEKREGANDE